MPEREREEKEQTGQEWEIEFEAIQVHFTQKYSRLLRKVSMRLMR